MHLAECRISAPARAGKRFLDLSLLPIRIRGRGDGILAIAIDVTDRVCGRRASKRDVCGREAIRRRTNSS